MAVFERLHREQGQTIVMGTHDRTLARRADRVLILRDGKIERAAEVTHETQEPRKWAMASKVWIDGKLVDRDDAKNSGHDHGQRHGDGAVEGIRVYGGKI